MLKLLSRFNITQKFLLFLLFASILPLIVVGATSYYVSLNVLKEEASQYTSEVVHNQKDYLELQLKQVESLIANLSGMEEILEVAELDQNNENTFDDLTTQSRIRSILDHYNYLEGLVSIDIFTLHGAHYHVGDTLDQTAIRTELMDALYDRAVNSTEPVLWTGIEENVNVNSGQQMVITAAKVLRRVDPDTLQSEPSGLILVNLSVDTLYNHFSNVNLAESAYLVLVDDQHRIIYHPDRSQIGRPFDSQLALQLSQDQGRFSGMLGNEPVLANYSHFSDTGWWIVALTPVNSINARMAPISLTTQITFAVSILIIAFAAGLISRKMVAPIQSITDQFKSLQKNLPDASIQASDGGQDEISELVLWFNTFLKSLGEKRKAEEALRESEELFRTLVENTADWIWRLDEKACFTYVSPNVEALLGYRPKELLGLRPFDLADEGETEQLKNLFAYLLSTGKRTTGLEATLLRKDRQPLTFEINGTPLFGLDRKVNGYTGICRDITQRKMAEAALRDSEERYALVVRGANDGIWDWNLRAHTVYYSPRWKSILGYKENEVSDAPSEWLARVHPEDIERLKHEMDRHLNGESPRFEVEHRIFHKSGRYRWMLALGLAVRDQDGQAYRMAGSLTDITARKSTEDRLRHDAMHDALTNLPNRAYFLDQMRRSLERARRHPSYLAAVLFMDLDRFKLVNDSLGHGSGDQMLMILSERLETCVRAGDLVARFGGDEFAVLLEDINSINDAILVANRIQAELTKPFLLKGTEVFSSASIGIAMMTSTYQRPEDLLRDADTAMYSAKAGGRSRYQIFNPEMHVVNVELLQLETELRRAIERNEFELYYQPVVSLSDGRITTLEALVRWKHPNRGLISPADFIPLAEENGLIVPLGEWVLRDACRQLRIWRDAGYTDLHVSVNISVRQFQDQNLCDLVRDALISSQLDGDMLQLEITESAAMQDFEMTTYIINELHHMGVKIAIDDFGTSYSSLGYLKRFPVSSIKIDQSFIRDIITDADDASITTAIIAMGHILNLKVVAEGVETEEQLAFLAKQECDEVQGYLFAHPMPAADVAARLNRPAHDLHNSMQ
jgi:diguanylate cyclase (GGDEF)-like protein/PAS domain S-box-containing protein